MVGTVPSCDPGSGSLTILSECSRGVALVIGLPGFSIERAVAPVHRARLVFRWILEDYLRRGRHASLPRVSFHAARIWTGINMGGRVKQ